MPELRGEVQGGREAPNLPELPVRRRRPGMRYPLGDRVLLLRGDRAGLVTDLLPRGAGDTYVPSADRLMISVAETCGADAADAAPPMSADAVPIIPANYTTAETDTVDNAPHAGYNVLHVPPI